MQQAIREKKEAYKIWQQNGSEIDREAYKQKRTKSKIVMASITVEEYKKWERNKGKPEMKRKRKGEKKIKRWKLKDESVKVAFEKSYEKRSESLLHKTQHGDR